MTSVHIISLEAIKTHREVALAIGVLDVQPDYVIRIVQGLELRINLRHVTLIAIVPATLMVPLGEEWW
jgi:hypothetical protein